MKKIKFIFALLLGKTIIFLSKNILHKNPTNYPGSIAYKIDKHFIKQFNINHNKVIFITGTNGKSTTNNLLVHILKISNYKIISNLEGANMLNGVATSLIKYSKINGNLDCDYLIFEIDERFLDIIYKDLPAKIIGVTNLQKDQVQRNGEPSYIYDRMSSILNKNITLFLNNDDPRSKSMEQFTNKTIYYGVDKNKYSFIKEDFFDITLPCPNCNYPIQYNYYNIDNIGKFKCSNCKYKSTNKINYLIKNINYKDKTFSINNSIYNYNTGPVFYFYCYALAISIALELKVNNQSINKALLSFKNIKGRFELFNYQEKTIKYVRTKQENPETLQHAIDYICQDNKPKILMLGLEELKDFIPNYTNTFYAYDCNFEKLKSCNIKKYICFSSSIAYDIANRLLYAGINQKDITIIPNDSEEKILNTIKQFSINNIYLITILKKYENIKKYFKEHENE